jgi:hypothetical protein
MTDSTMTAEPDSHDYKLSSSTLEHLRRNRGIELDVPGPVVHYVRRGLHLTMNAAAQQLAAEAVAAAEDATNRFARVPPTYAAALKHLDDVRAALKWIGWDAGGSQEPADDLSLDLFNEPELGVFYEAIFRANAASPSKTTATELGALLDTFNAAIEEADAAHEEWLSRPAARTY